MYLRGSLMFRNELIEWVSPIPLITRGHHVPMFPSMEPGTDGRNLAVWKKKDMFGMAAAYVHPIPPVRRRCHRAHGNPPQQARDIFTGEPDAALSSAPSQAIHAFQVIVDVIIESRHNGWQT